MKVWIYKTDFDELRYYEIKTGSPYAKSFVTAANLEVVALTILELKQKCKNLFLHFKFPYDVEIPEGIAIRYCKPLNREEIKKLNKLLEDKRVEQYK